MGGKRQYCSVIVLSGMVCYEEKLSFLVGIVALFVFFVFKSAQRNLRMKMNKSNPAR